jgi:hypothetical protein
MLIGVANLLSVLRALRDLGDIALVSEGAGLPPENPDLTRNVSDPRSAAQPVRNSR